MLSGLQSDPALFYSPSSSRPFLEQFICGGPTRLILSRRLTPSLRPKLQYLSLFLLKVQQCSPDMIQRKKAKQVLLKASTPPHLAIHACTLSPPLETSMPGWTEHTLLLQQPFSSSTVSSSLLRPFQVAWNAPDTVKVLHPTLPAVTTQFCFCSTTVFLVSTLAPAN